MAWLWPSPLTVLQERSAISEILLGLAQIHLLLTQLDILVALDFALQLLLHSHGTTTQLPIEGILVRSSLLHFLFAVSILMEILSCIIDRL